MRYETVSERRCIWWIASSTSGFILWRSELAKFRTPSGPPSVTRTMLSVLLSPLCHDLIFLRAETRSAYSL